MLGPLVDVQLKNVGARIVAYDIEVVLAANNLLEINFGEEDCFAIGVGSSKEIAKGINDATATATDYGFRIIAELGVVIVGKVAAALKLIAGEHEATSLDGDVADSGEPRVAGVGGRCAIKLDTLGIHSSAEQGHIVFPADNCAEFAEWCRKYRHGRAVAVAPYEALRSGRHELAMLAEESTVWGEKEDCAIESTCIAFHNANDQINVVGVSNSREMIEGGTGNVDAAFPVTTKVFTSRICTRPHYGSEVEAARVSGDESFWEQDEFRALLRCFACQGGDFLDGTLPIENNGRSLHNSYL